LKDKKISPIYFPHIYWGAVFIPENTAISPKYEGNMGETKALKQRVTFYFRAAKESGSEDRKG